MQMVFEMRYSYFGQSGWRSDASKDPELLFDPERLKRRAYYFEKIALASLASQTDQDFKLIVLSSRDLPEEHKEYLVEKCNEVLGPERVHIIIHPPGSAGRCFKNYLIQHLNESAYTAQIVLDDDDAVSSDFVSVMRREALAIQNTFEKEGDYCYLSIATGLSAFLSDKQWQFSLRNVPFTNLGLTLVAPTRTKQNPYMTAHKKIPLRHPSRLIDTQELFYIRCVHGLNDSRAVRWEIRAARGDRKILTREELEKIIPRFPFLADLPWEADP